MDFQKAIERNFVWKTEYGAGPEFLFGLIKKRELQRQRYRLDGTRDEDVVHERELDLGPLNVVHRSKNSNMLSGDDYKIAVTLFKLFTISNDKELLVMLKAGPSLGVAKTLLGMTPAALPANIVDLNCAARAGFRLNLSRFLRDLRKEETPDCDCETDTQEEDDLDLD
ncbi:MAG: hypothetical protein WCX65_14195 [bacterium]